MANRSYRTCGFTLLELLVVVAVIGLLLAILLPALSAANEAGRQAVCGANLNQLGVGSASYSEENDHYMPWFAFAKERPAEWEWWVTQLARGMEEFHPDVYRCPSDPVPYRVPVYYYNGLVYMNDGRRFSADTGNTLNNAPNVRPVRARTQGRTDALAAGQLPRLVQPDDRRRLEHRAR